MRGIAGYELRGLLGASEFTETHRARASTDRRAVALKVLRVQALPKDLAGLVAQRFLSAGRVASTLDVPGMASVVDAGDCEAGPYVATELVPGIDLAGVLGYSRKRSPGAAGLAPSLASAMAAHVAQVLANAHGLRTPLYHLALGPGNVRITATAQVKVLDFGHASLWRGLGLQVGRCGFMAPELLRVALPAVFDGKGAAADVYSLGVLLFYLLSGAAPFQADSFAGLLTQVARPLPDLPGAPDALVRAIRALTSPNPDHRPASAAAVVDLLGGTMSAEERERHIAAALLALPIRWGKKTAPPRLQRKSALVGRPMSRSRWLLPLVGAAAGLALVGWLAPAMVRGSRAPTPKAGPTAALTTATAGTPTSASLRLAHLAETDVPFRRAGIDGGAASDRVVVPMPKRRLPRVPNRLDLDTTPTGADIWVDGVLRGKTPVDLDLGPGGHRVVLLQDGQRMHRAVYDTTDGEWIRVPLQAAAPPATGEAHLNVTCRSGSRLPIFIDDEDTGRLCPASMLRVSRGPHKVGVFVPIRRSIVETEVDVAEGARPMQVVVKD